MASMQKNLGSNKEPPHNFFPIQRYRFPESYSYQFGFLKTQLCCDMTKEEMEKITGVNHHNIIGLKKIAKPRKSVLNGYSSAERIANPTDRSPAVSKNLPILYLLYYEIIPFSLQASLSKPMINVRPEVLQNNLESVMRYLQSASIWCKLTIENIGITETGVVKVYLPVPNILEPRPFINPQIQTQALRSLTTICNWYQKKYARNSQPSPTISKPLNLKTPSVNLHSNKLISNTRIIKPASSLNYDLSSRVKSEQNARECLSKNMLRQFQYNSPKKIIGRDKTIQIPAYIPESPLNGSRKSGGQDTQEPLDNNKKGNVKAKETTNFMQKEEVNRNNNNNNNLKEVEKAKKFLQQQNINCINIYHNAGRPIRIQNSPASTRPNQIEQGRLNLPSPAPNHMPYPSPNHMSYPVPNHMPYNHHDFDNQSVDTYQMELGEDYQMPRLGSQHTQRLRQTVLNKQMLRNNWDTLSHRTKEVNVSKNTRRQKVTESAGNHDFQRIIEKNKKILHEGPADGTKKFRQHDIENGASQIETVFRRDQEKEKIKNYNSEGKNKKVGYGSNLSGNKLGGKVGSGQNWQYQTIRSSDNSPDIQDRVQLALQKTKNVMIMLKNCRNSSASK